LPAEKNKNRGNRYSRAKILTTFTNKFFNEKHLISMKEGKRIVLHPSTTMKEGKRNVLTPSTTIEEGKRIVLHPSTTIEEGKRNVLHPSTTMKGTK
jgi:hypothetical protein